MPYMCPELWVCWGCKAAYCFQALPCQADNKTRRQSDYLYVQMPNGPPKETASSSRAGFYSLKVPRLLYDGESDRPNWPWAIARGATEHTVGLRPTAGVTSPALASRTVECHGSESARRRKAEGSRGRKALYAWRREVWVRKAWRNALMSIKHSFLYKYKSDYL